MEEDDKRRQKKLVGNKSLTLKGFLGYATLTTSFRLSIR